MAIDSQEFDIRWLKFLCNANNKVLVPWAITFPKHFKTTWFRQVEQAFSLIWTFVELMAQLITGCVTDKSTFIKNTRPRCAYIWDTGCCVCFEVHYGKIMPPPQLPRRWIFWLYIFWNMTGCLYLFRLRVKFCFMWECTYSSTNTSDAIIWAVWVNAAMPLSFLDELNIMVQGFM